jgi:hypothetical protein
MAASGRQVNFSGVKFTPSGGSAVPIPNVTDISINPRGQVISGRGDNNIMPVLKKRISSDHQVTIATESISVLTTLSVGDGAFEAILEDAKGGATTGNGALKVAGANGTIADTPIQARHGQFAAGSIAIEFASSDGTTSPLTWTAL